MKLTFLGTGTSTGIPVLGCSCPVCRSADPRDRRMRTSALLSTNDGRHVMIDCGPDVRQQLLVHHNGPVDGVIITHSHYDHVGGTDDLRTLSYETPVDIFCRADVADDLHRMLPYCFSGKNYPNIPRLNLNIIEEFRPFTAAGLEITPLPVRHGWLDILGYRIGDLGYITDASMVPDETVEALCGIDTLVINALRHTPNPTHQSLQESLAVIERVSPRRAFLIHMSHQMGLHDEASRLLHPGVVFAHDGMSIEL